MGQNSRWRRVGQGESMDVSRLLSSLQVFADATLVFPLVVAATHAAPIAGRHEERFAKDAGWRFSLRAITTVGRFVPANSFRSCNCVCLQLVGSTAMAPVLCFVDRIRKMLLPGILPNANPSTCNRSQFAPVEDPQRCLWPCFLRSAKRNADHLVLSWHRPLNTLCMLFGTVTDFCAKEELCAIRVALRLSSVEAFSCCST